jgi:hypothetical protein
MNAFDEVGIGGVWIGGHGSCGGSMARLLIRHQVGKRPLQSTQQTAPI